MAMHLGSENPGDDLEPMMEINTTPLIDVMLVLLVMLIITIPVQLHAVRIGLPAGTAPPPVVKPEVIEVDIDERDVVHWQGEALPDAAALQARLVGAAAAAVPPELHFRPAPGAHYETLAHAMSAAQRQGLLKLGVVDRPASGAR